MAMGYMFWITFAILAVLALCCYGQAKGSK